MNAKQIFDKTRPFCMAKLAIGGITVALSIVLFAILMGLGWLFGESGMLITFCLWLGGTGVIRFVIMHYIGYLIKAGHIAVITEAVTTGSVPLNQVEYGKQMVTARFATSNIYFAVDKLVSGAVKQIQRGIEKVGNALDFIPGMDAISGLAKFFVEISLGYVDECCLGYTFYKKDQGAFKSAADGVVIYAQNWKILLKSAAKTMLKSLLIMAGVILIVIIPFGLLFKIFNWSPLIALLLAVLVAWVIKFAFIDSYIMCQMMVAYMEAAPTTVITFDLYGKLSNLSSHFKELFEKGKNEGPTPSYASGPSAGTYSDSGFSSYTTAQPPLNTDTAQTDEEPVFCGQCGTKNKASAKFCASCGAKLS